MYPLTYIFNVYIQEVIDLLNGRTHFWVKINKRNINTLIFADDIVIKTEKENDIQDILRIMKEATNELGMKIHTKNMKVLICSKNGHAGI